MNCSDLSGWREVHQICHVFGCHISRKKKVYTATAGPLFSRSVARPRGHRAKKAMVYTIFLEKQGKRVYTVGPERRIYTIEPQTRKKKKRGVSTVVVYTFFFPVYEQRHYYANKAKTEMRHFSLTAVIVL